MERAEQPGLLCGLHPCGRPAGALGRPGTSDSWLAQVMRLTPRGPRGRGLVSRVLPACAAPLMSRRALRRAPLAAPTPPKTALLRPGRHVGPPSAVVPCPDRGPAGGSDLAGLAPGPGPGGRSRCGRRDGAAWVPIGALVHQALGHWDCWRAIRGPAATGCGPSGWAGFRYRRVRGRRLPLPRRFQGSQPTATPRGPRTPSALRPPGWGHHHPGRPGPALPGCRRRLAAGGLEDELRARDQALANTRTPAAAGGVCCAATIVTGAVPAVACFCSRTYGCSPSFREPRRWEAVRKALRETESTPEASRRAQSRKPRVVPRGLAPLRVI